MVNGFQSPHHARSVERVKEAGAVEVLIPQMIKTTSEMNIQQPLGFASAMQVQAAGGSVCHVSLQNQWW